MIQPRNIAIQQNNVLFAKQDIPELVWPDFLLYRFEKPRSRKPGRINSCVRNIAFQFCGYPDEETETKLKKNIGCSRFIWNSLLGDAIAYHEEHGIYQLNSYTKYKKDNPWLSEADSIALSKRKMELQSAFNDFFSGDKGLPKFKKKHLSKDSYYTSIASEGAYNLRLEGDILVLPKVGRVKLSMHRKIPEGAILKNCIVTHAPDGKWLFSLVFETEYTEFLKASVAKFLESNDISDLSHIGLDMSLPSLYIDSNGDKPSYYNKRLIEFEKQYRNLERRIAKEQCRLSRMVRGSNNYEKQCRKIAGLHAKAKHRRLDFLHQVSSRLSRKYDIVTIEDLDMRAIKRSLRFGKSVSDNGWGMFTQMLEYKLEREGGLLIRINKWFPSSKKCSCCGHVYKELKLSDRTYICPVCGTILDRDLNAAINIDTEGLNLLTNLYNTDTAKETISVKLKTTDWNVGASLLSYGVDVHKPSHNMSAG